MPLHFSRLLDSDKSVSREAQEVLIELGDAAFDGVIALLSHGRKEARIKAAGCLYEMADKRAVPALTRALGKERSKPVVVAIERALGACLEPDPASALGLYDLARVDALNPLLSSFATCFMARRARFHGLESAISCGAQSCWDMPGSGWTPWG